MNRKNNNQSVFIWALFAVTFSVILCGCTSGKQLRELTVESAEAMEENPDEGISLDAEAPEEAKETTDSDPTEVYVHVCGAVVKPGMYILSPGSRVYDAVVAAGGYAEQAEMDYINQAQLVSDGMKVRIPTKEECENMTSSETDAISSENLSNPADVGNADKAQMVIEGKVNINSADLDTLCTVTGIGEGRAQAIISYREEHQGFKQLEDIMNVDGIKQGTFNKIKEQICVW